MIGIETLRQGFPKITRFRDFRDHAPNTLAYKPKTSIGES
jgi:hypothetical protein